MALRNQPYIPLYVQDYLTDEKLNECCAASQGIYIKILCLMHKSEEYGTILLKQKDKQAAKRINNFAYKLSKHLLFTQDEIEKALIELLQENVLQIKGDILSQKRMINDNILSIKRAESGAKGGKQTQLAKAKMQANTEDEYEVEDETETGKIKYAEFVKMTEVEYSKLCKKHGKEFTTLCVDKLNNYKGSKGKKYKSDYRAILSWVIDEIKKSGVKSFNTNPLAGIE